jgi:uncharacterized membrane protein YraQ (UPF0718 family)
MAVIVGVPLYSDEVGVIPLVEAMLLKGVAVGTTLAFMMSIAAISLPELLILKKVMHWRALVCKGLYKSINNNYYPLDNIAT